MMISDVSLLDFMNNKVEKEDKTNGFVFYISKKDKEELHEIVEKTIKFVENLKKYKFDDKDKKDIENNSFVLLDNCIKNLSKRNKVYIEDADKIYVENVFVKDENVVFSKGIYKGKKVQINDMKNFLNKTILRDGIETAAKYCSLGKIKNKELEKELNIG